MIEVRGLIDTDIEAVVGGVFDFGNIVIQPNIATQVGVAVGGISGINFGNAGNASVQQLLGQASVSTIA